MITILFAWTIVAHQHVGQHSYSRPIYAWRPMGEFASPTDCQFAAKALGLGPERALCVVTGKKP